MWSGLRGIQEQMFEIQFCGGAKQYLSNSISDYVTQPDTSFIFFGGGGNAFSWIACRADCRGSNY